MDLTLGAEQESIRDAIREVLADRMPIARVRSLLAQDGARDRALWTAAGELGWFGLGVPEQGGGAGYGLSEEILLFVELGRSLAPGPWLGTVLAAHALGGAPALREVHRAVLAGTHGVAVIDDEESTFGEGRLTGEVAGVADGAGAQGFLVLGTQTVRYLAADARTVTIDPGSGIDPTRRVARVRFDDVTGEPVSRDAELLRQMATVLAAAEAVGVAERTLEASVEHGKVRQQFGRPIGSFQAVKHRCADMAVRAEVARSVTIFASVALRDREEGAARSARVAKALAVDAAIANASDNVQNHGGMGYTWEGDAHLYLKRAWLLEHVFGTRAVHLDALAAAWRAS
jgi:alkylation response protein AidB-like acyl-CoA dehydrogenase